MGQLALGGPESLHVGPGDCRVDVHEYGTHALAGDARNVGGQPLQCGQRRRPRLDVHAAIESLLHPFPAHGIFVDHLLGAHGQGDVGRSRAQGLRRQPEGRAP